MRLTNKQLPQHLQKQLAPFYLISGDDFLLVEEACQLIRAQAKQAGYAERVKYPIEPHFNWEKLLTYTQNYSLFSQQRLLEITMDNPKLNEAAGQIMQTLATTAATDTLFLVVTPKLPANIQASKWYKAIDKHGVCVTVWPLQRHEFLPWLKQRFQHAGITVSADALNLILANCEGNLLAASQTIEKLHLNYGARALTDEEVAQSVIDSAHYQIFDLLNALFIGNSKQALRILTTLRQEGTETSLILWAISKELRQLYNLAFALQQGQTLASLWQTYYVREPQKPLLAKCLQRHTPQQLYRLLCHAATIDLQIKGVKLGNVWDELQQLCLMLAHGATLLPNTSIE